MWRWALALPFAVSTCWGIFSLMAWMLGLEHQVSSKPNTELSYQLVEQANDIKPARRQRTILPLVPSISEPILAPAPQQHVSRAASLNVSRVDVGLLAAPSVDFAFVAPELAMPESELSTSLQPSYRQEPIYPAEALRKNIEGFVLLKFTLNKQGKAVEIDVLDAQPPRTFEKNAIKALRTWRYPVIEGVDSGWHKIQLDFRLAL